MQAVTTYGIFAFVMPRLWVQLPLPALCIATTYDYRVVKIGASGYRLDACFVFENSRVLGYGASMAHVYRRPDRKNHWYAVVSVRGQRYLRRLFDDAHPVPPSKQTRRKALERARALETELRANGASTCAISISALLGHAKEERGRPRGHEPSPASLDRRRRILDKTNAKIPPLIAIRFA